MIKENQKYFNRLLLIFDIICIPLSILIAWVIRFNIGIFKIEGTYLPLTSYLKLIYTIPIYIILYEIYNLYKSQRRKSILYEFISITKSNLLALLIITLFLYIFKEIDYSRYYLVIFTIININITFGERFIIRSILRSLRVKGKNLKHIIFVGFNLGTKEFLNKINENKYWGYCVDALFYDNFNLLKTNSIKRDDNENEQVAASTDKYEYCNDIIKKINNSNSVYKINMLENYIVKHNIDEVYITLNYEDFGKIKQILYICEKYGVRTQIIPDYYKLITAKPYLDEVDGIPIISTRYIPLDIELNKLIKRLFDIIFSILSIIIFSPIMIIVSFIIKITSPGPVIYRQERVGMNRKLFTIYKFRSMCIQEEKEEKLMWTTSVDLRKTKFGEFIRKTSLDELPQLFNVLKGDMSLIGPRPERPQFVEKFMNEIPRYMVKHQVRPGMTGWAQVNGFRGDTSIEKRIEYDIYYIENWSVLLDIKILWLTLFKGFINKNAY